CSVTAFWYSVREIGSPFTVITAPATRAREPPLRPEPSRNTNPPRKVTTTTKIRIHQMVLVCLPVPRRYRSIEGSSRPDRPGEGPGGNGTRQFISGAERAQCVPPRASWIAGARGVCYEYGADP